MAQSVTTALREAADLLDQHPDLPQPYITSSSDGSVRLNWYLNIHVDDLADQKALAAAIVKAVGGAWTKDANDYDGGRFSFTQARGLLWFNVQTQREAVCERVVTGTETVLVPAKPAEPERTIERETVEWRCEPLLAEVAS